MHALRLVGAMVVCFLVVLASGCGRGGGKLNPVVAEGVLTWEDGKPVSQATIVFLPNDPQGKQASGLTGKDGAFTLTTYNQNDGAVPGDYKIIVTKGSASVAETPQEKDPTKLMKEFYEKSKDGPKKGAVPDIYANPKTTPLKWRVEAGGAKINLKLKTL